MLLPIQIAGTLRFRETSVIRPNNEGVQAQAEKTCTLIDSGTRCEPMRVGNYILGNLVCIDTYLCTTVGKDGSIHRTFDKVETSCGECTPDLGSGGVLSLPLPIGGAISAPLGSQRANFRRNLL
jgi:hypothetical protein